MILEDLSTMQHPDVSPSPRIVTPRLVLRAWTPDDAPALKRAIDGSLEHLRPSMPWAHAEPSSLDVLAERLVLFRSQFESGADWIYGIFASDDRTVVGGTGLHPRIGPTALEIGYWVARDATRQGFAVEAVEALTRHALQQPGIGHTEIRCDPVNVASASVARRSGYRHEETLKDNKLMPDGQLCDTMVWRYRVRSGCLDDVA